MNTRAQRVIEAEDANSRQQHLPTGYIPPQRDFAFLREPTAVTASTLEGVPGGVLSGTPPVWKRRLEFAVGGQEFNIVPERAVDELLLTEVVVEERETIPLRATQAR